MKRSQLIGLMHNSQYGFPVIKLCKLAMWSAREGKHWIQMFLENSTCPSSETSNVSAKMTFGAKSWNIDFIIFVNGYLHLSTLLVIWFVDMQPKYIA